MKIKYTCRACGTYRREIEVDDRKKGDDVIEWMKGVQIALLFDHTFEHPECKSEMMEEVLIPKADFEQRSEAKRSD